MPKRFCTTCEIQQPTSVYWQGHYHCFSCQATSIGLKFGFPTKPVKSKVKAMRKAPAKAKVEKPKVRTIPLSEIQL